MEDWIISYGKRGHITNEYTKLYVKYNMKNGKVIYRTYYIKLEDNTDIVNNLLTSEEYYEIAYPINILKENVDKIHLYTDVKNIDLYLSDDEIIELLYIYKEEFINHRFDFSKKEIILGELKYMKKTNSSKEDNDTVQIGPTSSYSLNIVEIASYPIYSSFKNTIAYMNNKGYILH